MKLIIFGAGAYGKEYIQKCVGEDEILAIADNFSRRRCIFGIKIIRPAEIAQFQYDKVVICLESYTPKQQQIIRSVYDQLIDSGISRQNIILASFDYRRIENFYPRHVFLHELADQFIQSNMTGSIAECGVLHGQFAADMNGSFPAKKMYLFDTFTGFDERDTKREEAEESKAWLAANSALYTSGSDFITLLRCPHFENAVIRKGFVPETFAGLESEEFCFVNLDMDLYAPTLAALRFFAPRMVRNGVILLHDYYCVDLPGIKQAVDEFAQVYKDFLRMPIGDGYSVALVIQ